MSNVKVAVRVRPINKRELEQNGKVIVDTNGDTVSVTNLKVDSQAEYGDSRERVKNFTFDYCYDSTGEPRSLQYAPQQQVFQDLGTEILQAAFEGYNACVLAYGQTSTGKTYTMTGTQDDPGLIPRICEGLFSHVDDFEATDITFRVHISYLEIYNERVRDLLRPSLSRHHEKYTLKVREHPKEGPYVQDLSSHVVKDNEQIQTLLDKGNESRTTASTYMHDHSSRSHAIVTINFIQAKLEDDLPHEIVSKIHLVDLAGSERADPNWSLNYKGRLKEGSNINKSLVTLGNVIKSLAEKSILSWSTDSLGSTQSFTSSGGGEGRASPYCSPKRLRLPYIPYRDSVLTWLLKDSLGGNSKTIMIATVSPASICYNETLSTLRYAQRAKNIVNKPKINEDASVTLIRELRQEIDRLKQLLAGTQMGYFPQSDVMYVVPFQKAQEEGEALFPLQDTSNTLQKELQLQEDRADKLTQTWMDKWMETHEIIKESDISIRGLHKKASSMGVLIDSQMPHLIGMDNDILSTGVIIYHLKEGKTLVGREDAKREQDIVLSGPAIQREHCYIKNISGSVTLYPNRGSLCTVNGLDCKGPTLLKQGDSVILGKTQMFRFNNPEEAALLRDKRASQENLLDESSQPCENKEYSQYKGVQTNRLQSLYASTEFCLQLENQYQTETEKIERAKEELDRLKQEHLRAEEQRQLKEEELWKTHDRHLQEIEEEKKRLTKLKEETFIQRQKADQELQYARECLAKEQEAFYQQLQGELSKVIASKAIQGNSVFQENVDCDKAQLDIIRKRKLSVEGQLKIIAQKEILKTLSHQETERSLRKKCDDLEDEFENSKHQIESQLGKIREIEEHYRHTDAIHYTEISKTKEELDEIQQRKEQLELYIEEKEDLLMVKSDKPRPLRTACSAEVLTDLEIETEFSQRTSSMLALNRGSVGDLPAISHQFSLSSMMSVDSQSMDSDLHTRHFESESKSNANVKHAKISSEAKSVTDRLYQKSTPKFKYEPKHKKNISPAVENKTRGRQGLKSDHDSSHRSHSNGSPSNKNVSPDKKRRSSPNNGESISPPHLIENQTLVRNSSSKRHAKSSASLASVPEAVGEEGDDQIMHSTPDISQVVRRRKGGMRKTFDDEFRRHSEPMGEELADAFEKYTQEMEKSSGDNPAYRHSKSEDDSSGGYSLNIPEVTVSDHNGGEQSYNTFQNNRFIASRGQECQVSMDESEGQESLVTMEDNGSQLQCHVSMEENVDGMECDLDTVSQEPYIVINSEIQHAGDNNTNTNDDMCRSFKVDLMPIINVSYSQGEVPIPVIPQSYTGRQNTSCQSSNFFDGQDQTENLRTDIGTVGNDDEMIRIGSKRELKQNSGTTAVPSKLRKGDKNNYEWLVNAITNLSKEKLLVSGEDNENEDEIVDDNDSLNYENIVGENYKGLNEQSSDKNFDGLSTTDIVPLLDNDNLIKQNDTTNMTVSNTEQEYLDNNEVQAYYSDSLDEDSLDGSKPVRYHDEEDTSDSFDSSGGDNNDNIDGKEENNLDNTENGVMEYFSDVDPDLVDEMSNEEIVEELSDYDDVADDIDEDRTEIYLQYPTDFPGSLLYSIKEESVPASPDQSESKDLSSELSSIGDQTLDGIDDNYLSQVVVLGQEDQAIVLMTEKRTNDHLEFDSDATLNISEQENNEQCTSNESKIEPMNLSNDSSVRSETHIVLTTEMEELEESPVVYHHIGTSNGENGNQDSIDLKILKKSEQQNKTGVGSYNVSDEELDLSETLKEEFNDIGVDDESYEEQKNENHENCDENNFTDSTKNEEKRSDISDSLSGQQNNKDNIGINLEAELTPVDMTQYLSNVARSIRQALVVDTDSDSLSNSSMEIAVNKSSTHVVSKQSEKDMLESSKQCPSVNVETDQNFSSKANEDKKLTEGVDIDVLVSEDNSLTVDNSSDQNGTEIKEQDTSKISLKNDDAPKVEKVKRSRPKPETRTLGVSTSPDLVTVSCGEDIASDDSLQEVQEELQVLQEALDNKGPKNSYTNGNSLSSARKATRKRAMQKRGSGVCTESEDLMSDDSPGSQGKSSSSRPDSASRRRRRPNTKSADRSGKKTKGLSSDEYITSENNSIYSDDSPSRNKDNETNKEEISIDVDQPFNDCMNEFAESGTENDGLEENNMDGNITNGYSKGDSDRETFDSRQKSLHVNGNYIPNLQLSGISPRDEDFKEQSSEYNGSDSQQISWRSYESSEGRSSRSTSETRDVSQQTDSSFPPLRSPMSTQTVGRINSLATSPISVWNSVDKCIKSPLGFSDGTKEKSAGGKKMVKMKQCKLSDLSFTSPDTWSADTTGLPSISINEMESGSEGEGDDVVMETETCSPATPSKSDNFFESSCMVLQEPPSGRHAAVKYEVTIKPEETSIHYNVEKTEYKTYGLHSPNRDSENITFPESININITDRTANVTENRHETLTRQHFQLSQATEDSPSGDIVSERTFRSSRELSANCSDSNVEIRSDRSSVEKDEKHFVETTCENNPIDNDGLIEKHQYGLSPRESDTTSDYGTMIYDRRRGVSAAYDSDDIDSLASYGKYFSESHENTPRGLIMKEEDHVVEDLSSRNLHDGTQNLALKMENVSDNLQPQQDTGSTENLVYGVNVTDISQKIRNLPLPEEERKSNVNHDHSRSSEDVYISADISRASSESSDYRTPRQSPRENVYENIEIPDISDNSANLVSQIVNEDIRMLKTVSVNTELQEKENRQSREQVIRETLKNELQKKIDDLKHNGKSKDDSAISSDYTDGDSVTIGSPRACQLYESDKTLRIGNIRPNNIEVRTTRTDSSFEPSTGAQSYLPKLVDIDNKSIQKIPLKDSGNVFDDEDLEELVSETTEYLSGVQDKTNDTSDGNVVKTTEQHTSVCIENEMYEDPEKSDRSLSPGEIISDDLYEQFASGLNSGGEIDVETECDSRNIADTDRIDGHNDYSTSGVETTSDEISDGRKSIELIEMMESNSLMKEKSPSLSDIRKRKDFEEYRRSVSENCIDQYEETTTMNSSSSNDSIVFVFMGQSHTRESMEKLKKYTSKQKGYKVHESDDNILSQNHGDDNDMSYRDSDDKLSDESMDSHEEMMANMQNILSHDGVDSLNVSEEIGTDSQEISEEIGLDSQDISEGNYSQDISEGNYSQDISEGNYSQDIDSMEDNLDKSDNVFSGETSPVHDEVMDEMVKQEVNRTQAGLVHNDVSKQYNEDDEPLRHRFGIDESILPIPTRSISSDNLPRKISNHQTMHRSRSTSLLDVETVEKTNSSSDNEGIFPPNVQHSEHNSQEFEHNDNNNISNFEPDYDSEILEICTPDMPPTPATSVVDDTDENKQPSHAINQDVLYSSLAPLQSQQSQLDHNGNVEDVNNTSSQRRSLDNGQSSNQFVSVGVQASLADSETQTDLILCPDGQMMQVLPGLDSPFRAQSLGTLQGRMTQFNPSEDSENWYHLSSLMLETIPLLKTINERLPGADISLASSVENVIVGEATTLATQTTDSLEDLSSTAVQTDQDMENKIHESGIDVAAISTQTELQELEHSFTDTFDVMPDDSPEKIEISIQTDTPEIRVTEHSDICLQTDFIWSMASHHPVTTTTGSLFTVERPSANVGLETDNMSNTITNSMEESVTAELANQVSHTRSYEKDIISEDLRVEDEDSSEEQYSETCVLFYDFVNKCYIQSVVESESSKVMKGDKSRSDHHTVDTRYRLSEKDENVGGQETVRSHSTNNHNDGQIDDGVRIHPRYSEYSYKSTTSKQTDDIPDQSEVSKTSYLSKNEPHSYRQENSHGNTENRDKMVEEQTINELYKSHGEENVSRDYFSMNKGPRSYKLKYTEDEVSSEKKSPSLHNEAEEQNIKPTYKFDRQEMFSHHTEPRSYKLNYMDKDETSTPSETKTDQTSHKEEYVSVMDENIDESPEEEYSEEIVTFEIPIKADVQERSMSEILTLNHMPRTYKEQYMENEFVRDQSSDSSEEEIREEIETFEIPIDMAVQESLFSSEDKPSLYKQKYTDGEFAFDQKLVSSDNATTEENIISTQRSRGEDTIPRELFSVQTKPRSYEEKYMDNEIVIDRNIESPNEEITEIVTYEMPTNTDVQEPSLADIFKSERKPLFERFVDDEDIVEDIVSPRRDDTLTRDYLIPTQAGIRQNTNTNTQNSNSSQQSQSSQSDTSQRSSETGQSEHHSFESKTVKRSKIPDDDSDDENRNGKDEVFTEQTSEHHHSKHDNTQIQTILTEREHVMETEFYVPDIEASQAEMEALKEEHERTMAAIRKAAAERKTRTDELKSKTKQVIKTEFEMTKEVENWNDEETEKRNNDSKQVTFDMNAVETREYSIISEESGSQKSEDLAEKTSETDYMTETRLEKPEIDESEKKLQQLEEMWKGYVRVEQELKKRQEESDEKTKNDLIDDVLSDSEDMPNDKQSQLRYSNEPIARPNFREYKVQTRIETEEPISPITKVDKADITFMPTYSVDYRRERPKTEEDVQTYNVDNRINRPINDNETIVKESFTQVRSARKPTSLDKKPAYLSSDKKPAVSSNEKPSITTPVFNQPIANSDKIPAILTPEKKSVSPLPRSVSVDTYSRNKGSMRSTGVEVSVASSDDFTQTDDIVPVYEPAKNSQRNNDLNGHQIKSELDRLHNERIEIIEMLALNYLPASLTVELLEAKLNYCIGQTDLLLDSLEDTWKIQEAIDISESHNTHIVTKEYLTKYREDLRKSKKDIKICKERMDIKSGKGRGRPLGRNRDICRLRRQAEIEAFRVERKLEQQNFNTVKTINRLAPAVDHYDRKTRSASPNSSKTIYHHTMTPSEHAAYLIKLRKQVVKATEQEELRHRISRSCSPYVGHKFDSEYSPLTSPRTYSAYSSERLSVSPRISVSVREPIENGMRSYTVAPRSPTSPRSYSADTNYYSSNYQQNYITDNSGLNRRHSVERSGSYRTASPLYNRTTSPQYNRTTSPQYNRTLSPSYNGATSPNYNLSPLASPRRLSLEQETFSESVYSVNESQQLLREIQEARQHNQREITRAEETLQSYNRYGTNSDSHRPSSQYTNSNSDLLDTTLLSGSYELYDERSSVTMSRSSSCRSLDRDSDSVQNNYLSPRYEHDILHTRPVRSSDIKSRIHTRRRMPRTT